MTYFFVPDMTGMCRIDHWDVQQPVTTHEQASTSPTRTVSSWNTWQIVVGSERSERTTTLYLKTATKQVIVSRFEIQSVCIGGMFVLRIDHTAPFGVDESATVLLQDLRDAR